MLLSLIIFMGAEKVFRGVRWLRVRVQHLAVSPSRATVVCAKVWTFMAELINFVHHFFGYEAAATGSH